MGKIYKSPGCLDSRQALSRSSLSEKPSLVAVAGHCNQVSAPCFDVSSEVFGCLRPPVHTSPLYITTHRPIRQHRQLHRKHILHSSPTTIPALYILRGTREPSRERRACPRHSAGRRIRHHLRSTDTLLEHLHVQPQQPLVLVLHPQVRWSTGAAHGMVTLLGLGEEGTCRMLCR